MRLRRIVRTEVLPDPDSAVPEDRSNTTVSEERIIDERVIDDAVDLAEPVGTSAPPAERFVPSRPPDPERREWRGFVLAGLLGGSIGTLLLLPIAFVPLGASLVTQVLVVMILGWIVGAAVAISYWNNRTADLSETQIEMRR